jgi:Flp pilus assembly protein TadD
VQQRHPTDFWINFDLARLLMNTQPPQVGEAIGYYRTAVALRPQSSVAHSNLGLALRDNGRLDEAIVEFHEAIRVKKDLAEVHLNLGLALADKGQLAQWLSVTGGDR